MVQIIYIAGARRSGMTHGALQVLSKAGFVQGIEGSPGAGSETT